MKNWVKLKPQTVVCTYTRDKFGTPDALAYYEVRGLYHNVKEYLLAQINPETGAIYGAWTSRGNADLELVAPTHPVYIRWAQRRLQDRLEGLDRQ